MIYSQPDEAVDAAALARNYASAYENLGLELDESERALLARLGSPAHA